MSVVSPIGSVRVAAIRPAMPDPGADPYEEGLDVEVVTEAVAAPQVTMLAPVGAATGSGHDPQRRGNQRIATGFDRMPAVASEQPALRSTPPQTPFERAMRSYAMR